MFSPIKPFIWIDYSIVALISMTVCVGTMRGFSREVMSLLWWVIGFWASLHFSIIVSNYFQFIVCTTNKRLAMSFVGLLLFTILTGGLLQSFHTKRVKQTYNHTILMEKFGGFFCGMMQGIVITTIIVFLAGLTKLPSREWWQESSLLPSFQFLAIWLRDHVALQMANTINYR